MVRVLLLAALLPACTGEKEFTGLTCTSAVNTNVTTVIDLTCTAVEAGTLRVDFGLAGDLTEGAPEAAIAADTPLTIPLYGMPEGSTVDWRATWMGGTAEGSVQGAAANGQLPAGMDPITLTTPEDQLPGFRYLLGNVFGGQPASLVWNQRGEIVWYRLVDRSLWTIEVMFSHTQAVPTILSNEFSTDHALDAGQIWRVSGEAEVVQSYDPILSHHVFTEVGPDAPEGAAGTIAYLAMDVRPWYDAETDETVDVVGDKVVEVAPDGTTRVLFSTWDWIEVTKPIEWDVPFYPQGKDWTHSNSLHYYVESDTYLLSIDHLQTLVEIRRIDGVPVRWIGPDHGGTADGIGIAEGSLAFYHQHDAQYREGGLLTVYTTDEGEGHSGGVTYRLDEAAGNLVEEARHGFPAGLRSAFLGQVEPLTNGNTLVNYGSARLISELTPTDQAVWSLTADPGTSFGQVHPFDDFYSGR